MTTFSVDVIAKEDAIVKTMVTDLAGRFKEIIFPARTLPEIIKNGVAYDGSSFQGINNINASDSILKGNPETLIKIPDSIADTNKTEYWIVCDILGTNGEPHPNCARGRLKSLQGDLSAAWDGGNLFMGSEPEAFFIDLEKKESLGDAGGGNGNYFNPKDQKSIIITEIAETLEEMGFELERAHTEVGEDQFEINWKYDRAERTADKIQIYKLVAHKVARNYGYDVTFLPKPYPSRNGSGMHCHISVSNDKANLFYDAEGSDRKNFSETSLKFLQGILSNVRAISAIANSTEVSFARLVPGYEAPCIVAIGDCNRSAACRIPAIADPETRKFAIRTEFRFPDPMCNPYLLACGFIAAGMWGIEHETFKGFTDEDLFQFSLNDVRDRGFDLLPRNLWEAYLAFEESAVMRTQLGENIFETYKDLLLTEIDECQSFANTESMRRHYFD